MFTIRSSRLSLDIIDPVADRHLLGSRYCTGGYIFQARNDAGQELLSGPYRGEDRFDVFDGQGAPEVFVTALGQDTAEIGDEVPVIGVGRVRRTSHIMPFHVRNNPEVTEFTAWDIDIRTGSILMRSMQSFGGWRFLLSRSVIVDGAIVVSKTRLENFGDLPVPVKWFSHPFFPLMPDGKICSFSLPVHLPENPGYLLDAQGFIIMNKGFDWNKGLFQKLGFEPGGPLSIRQCHPLSGEVRVACSFTPQDLAVWANRNTFSFEAFFEAMVRQEEAQEWEIRYNFIAD